MRSAIVSCSLAFVAHCHATAVRSRANPFLRTPMKMPLMGSPPHTLSRSKARPSLKCCPEEQQQLVELETMLSEVETLWFSATSDVAYLRQLKDGKSDKVPDVRVPQVAGKLSLAKLAEVLTQQGRIQTRTREEIATIRQQLEETGQPQQVAAQIQKLTWCTSTEVIEMEELVETIKEVRQKVVGVETVPFDSGAQAALPASGQDVVFHALRPAFLFLMPPRAKGNLLDIIMVAMMISLVGSGVAVGVLTSRHGASVAVQRPLLASYS